METFYPEDGSSADLPSGLKIVQFCLSPWFLFICFQSLIEGLLQHTKEIRLHFVKNMQDVKVFIAAPQICYSIHILLTFSPGVSVILFLPNPTSSTFGSSSTF